MKPKLKPITAMNFSFTHPFCRVPIVISAPSELHAFKEFVKEHGDRYNPYILILPL